MDKLFAMYAGNKESDVDTRIRLFKQQRTKTTTRIPPDADSAKPYIVFIISLYRKMDRINSI